MLSKAKKIGIIPVFVSHMGCPNDCTFCNQRKITGTEEAIKPEDLYNHVMGYLETMKRDCIELAFFGGSFTGIEVNTQEAYLAIAHKLKLDGFIQKIRLSTRPDYINQEVIDRLKFYSVDLVELGCQSFDEDVLLMSKRGHTANAIYLAISQLKSNGIDFGIQLMLGLPGDHYDKFMRAVSETIDLKPKCVRLYPAIVIKNTELEALYHNQLYKPLSLDEAIAWTADALSLFEKVGIRVIRMGLQRSDLIDFDKEIVAGPFHPAFGELVYSKLFLKSMTEMLMLMDLHESACKIDFSVNIKQVSPAMGQKQYNKQQLMDILKKKSSNQSFVLTIKGDPAIEYNKIRLTCGDYVAMVDIIN